LATAQVNRLWHSLFGRGLIEPIDDLRDTNPATHPELLDRLTQDFIDHDYDLRHTLRLIANSAAYQRGGKAEPAAKNDDRFLSHARPRPLAPEVLLDAIADATALPTQYSDRYGRSHSEQGRAITLYDPELAAGVLGPLAPCFHRLGNCQTGGSPATLDELDAQLHWINGPLVNDRVSDGRNEFNRLARTGISTRRLIDEFHLRTLSRLPTDEEAKFWLAKLSGTSRHAKCEDFAWALLSCPEFVTNH
jgi:hypothetical protein